MRIKKIFALSLVVPFLSISSFAKDFKSVSINRSYGNCKASCVKVDVKYQLLDEKDNKNKNINKYLRLRLARMMSENIDEQNKFKKLKDWGNLDKISNEIVHEYQKFRSYEKRNISWDYQLNGKVMYKSTEFVSFDLSSYIYAGGAHGTPYSEYSTFRLADEKKLELNDLGDIEAITKKGEEIFRKDHKIPEAQSLNSSGYWFDKDKFYLPNNFYLTPNGVEFLYNVYQISSYAEGPVSLFISNKDFDFKAKLKK